MRTLALLFLALALSATPTTGPQPGRVAVLEARMDDLAQRYNELVQAHNALVDDVEEIRGNGNQPLRPGVERYFSTYPQKIIDKSR